MAVNSVLDSLGVTQDLTTQASPPKALDQNTFLRLFITQLQNQDPLNPTDNEQFVAQLAQFSSLEQATQTTSLLQNLIAQGDERGRLDSVGLIGHQVLATGNTLEVDETGKGNLAYQLSGNVSSGTISITDLAGNLVQTLALGTQGAGQHTFEWDGLNADEQPVSPGVYQFSVNPLNAEGASVSVTTFLRESVKSALWENGQTQLTLASGRSLSTDDVLSVF